MLTLHCNGGRYPGTVRHDAATVTATLVVRDGLVTIRVDDSARHPERWEEFSVPLADLLAAISNPEDSRERPASHAEGELPRTEARHGGRGVPEIW
jgi:hypothetical protein